MRDLSAHGVLSTVFDAWQREENDGARLHEVRPIQDGRAGIPGLYVVRGGQRGIDAAPPGVRVLIGDRRNLERERLPVSVQQGVQQETAAQGFQRERQRARVTAPVRAIECYAMPLDRCALQDLVERVSDATCDHVA